MAQGYVTKYLKRKDNVQIFFRFWAGKKDMPVLILLHGICSHSLRFEYLANYFQKKNFNIYSFDFTGFGKSQSFQGYVESFNTYINETLAMVKLSNMDFPDNERFVVGEDIGGVVGLYFAKYYQKLIDGLILLSPAVKIKLHIPFQKLVNALLKTVVNKYHQIDLPFTNEMLTRDFEMQQMLHLDELDGKTVTAKFYFAMMESLKKLNKIAKQVNIPVYILQAGNDLLVDVDCVREVFGYLNSRVKELNILPDFYHSLSLDTNRQLVFQLMEKWINKVLFLEEKIKESH